MVKDASEMELNEADWGVVGRRGRHGVRALREKRIKRWPRNWKYDLIHKENPAWRDLAGDFGFPPLPLM
jgi:hypothetical protein